MTEEELEEERKLDKEDEQWERIIDNFIPLYGYPCE